MDEEREADQWWDSLTPTERVGIYRWLRRPRATSVPVHEDQTTILDEVNA